MNASAFVLLVGLAIHSGDVTELIRKDKAALQGTWRVVAAADNGDKVAADDLKDLLLTFKGDSILVREGGKTDEKFAFLLEPTRKPREIDMIYKAGAKKGQIDRGIYLLDGDTLKICMQSNKDAARPRDFVSRAGSRISLVILERTKQ